MGRLHGWNCFIALEQRSTKQREQVRRTVTVLVEDFLRFPDDPAVVSFVEIAGVALLTRDLIEKGDTHVLRMKMKKLAPIFVS